MRWNEAIVPTTANAGFWEGLRAHELRAAWCHACTRWSFYPRAACPHCGALGPELRAVRGAGRVYAVTTVRRSPFEDLGDAPYDVALVDLEEGFRVMGRLLEAPAGSVPIGSSVEVAFVDAAPGKPWYGFVPRRGGGAR